MLADGSVAFCVTYEIFILLIHDLRTKTFFEFPHDILFWVKYMLELAQTIALMLILVVDIDYNPGWHMVIAGTIVLATILRETLIAFYAKNNFRSKVFHCISIIMIISLAVSYVVTSFIIPYADRRTYLGLVEYVLFKFICISPVFNLQPIRSLHK